jgi:hypothetical protein
VKSFNDTLGREWKIDITIGALARVKSAMGLDLLAPHEVPGDDADERARSKLFKGRKALLVSVLNSDPSLLFDVIANILAPQMEAKKVPVEDFVESMGGDAAYSAYRAFVDEWSDFFLKFHRPDAAAMVLKHAEMIEAESKRDVAMVEKVGATVERTMARNRTEAIARLDSVGNGETSIDSLVTSE